MLPIVLSLVLPHLEYAIITWFPTSNQAQQRMEQVQRQFTRKITGCATLTYWERLKALNLKNIQLRFEAHAVTHIFKILHGLVPNPGVSFTFNNQSGFNCEGPTLTLKNRKGRTLFSHHIMCRGPLHSGLRYSIERNFKLLFYGIYQKFGHLSIRY